jgi:hypothetical protein
LSIGGAVVLPVRLLLIGIWDGRLAPAILWAAAAAAVVALACGAALLASAIRARPCLTAAASFSTISSMIRFRALYLTSPWIAMSRGAEAGAQSVLLIAAGSGKFSPGAAADRAGRGTVPLGAAVATAGTVAARPWIDAGSALAVAGLFGLAHGGSVVMRKLIGAETARPRGRDRGEPRDRGRDRRRGASDAHDRAPDCRVRERLRPGLRDGGGGGACRPGGGRRRVTSPRADRGLSTGGW